MCVCRGGGEASDLPPLPKWELTVNKPSWHGSFARGADEFFNMVTARPGGQSLATM